MIFDFLARSWFFLDFLARLIAKILARNLRNPRSWQQMKKIHDLGKKFKIIQDYPRSWQENQDTKHWVFLITCIQFMLVSKKQQAVSAQHNWSILVDWCLSFVIFALVMMVVCNRSLVFRFFFQFEDMENSNCTCMTCVHYYPIRMVSLGVFMCY